MRSCIAFVQLIDLHCKERLKLNISTTKSIVSNKTRQFC